MNLQTIIFVGKSGSGKGTQAEKMIEYINANDDKSVFHLEAGQRFRDFISKNNTYASELSKGINEEGELQPAFLSVWAWGGELVCELEKEEHLLIDGTPRRVIESSMLDDALEFFKRENITVVYINIGDDVATERLKERGRSDDLDVRDISKRLEWFSKDVIPVIELYKTRTNVRYIELDGTKDIDSVHKEIVKGLNV
ncbi:MAG: adenylate kinase family enzyme [Candidatus Paceibacteria bacterium]|jgi:adenylate kinase family enzyme